MSSYLKKKLAQIRKISELWIIFKIDPHPIEITDPKLNEGN